LVSFAYPTSRLATDRSIRKCCPKRCFAILSVLLVPCQRQAGEDTVFLIRIR
jgi:hypothetical protein